MEPVTSILSAILKVLQQIAIAEKEARRNKERCRDLAERAKVVSSVLRDAKAMAPGRKNDDGAAAARRMVLRRLRDALGDALKLIESCGGRDGGGACGFLGPWVASRLNSGARAARFHDVDKRINNCLFELSAASGASIEKKIDRLSIASARDHHHQGANKQQKKEAKAGNAPQKGATGQGGQNGGNGGRKRKGKKKNTAAAVSRPPPPPPVASAPQNGHSCTAYHHLYHSVEEDPNSCSVM